MNASKASLRSVLAAAVCLLLLACGEGVTDPDPQPLSEQETSLSSTSPSLQGSTGPITISHSAGTYQDMWFTVGNNHPPDADDPIFFPPPPPTENVVTVARFDPSLGELLSAQVIIDAEMSSRLLNHAMRFGARAWGEFNARFFSSAALGPVLESLTGTSTIEFERTYSGLDEDLPEASDGGNAHFEIHRHGTQRWHFDETYTGVDAQVFVDGGPDSRPLTIGRNPGAGGFLGVSGVRHEGRTRGEVFAIKTEPPTGQTVPGVGTLARVVLSFLMEDSDGEHDRFLTEVLFSDLHGSAAAVYNLEVHYTYQPNRPPVCTEAVASVEELWPPDGRMVPIDILGVTDPDDDPVTITITDVLHDDANAVRGNHEPSPDALGVGTSTAHVRAERSGAGDGRIYEIDFVADDGRGESCSGTVQVSVPHDRRHAEGRARGS